MNFKFDIAIIGAGITGITIARELISQNPNLKIVILEQTLLGGGASRYSAGLHIPHGHNLEVQALAKVSQEYYANLMIKENTSIFPLRFFGIAEKEKYQAIHTRFVKKIVEHPFNYGLGNNKIERVDIHDNKIMFSINDAHYANVLDVINYYIRNKEFQQRVMIWEGTKVINISINHEDINIFLQNEETIISKKLILTPGPWVNEEIFKPMLSSLKIRIKKIVALHIAQVPKSNDAGIYFFDHDAFLLPLYQLGYWLFSYTCQEWDVLPNINKLAITSEDRFNALNILDKYYPSLVEKANSGRVFCDAYSSNKAPIITSVSNQPKVIFAGAASGSGYRLAPGIAKIATSMVLS